MTNSVYAGGHAGSTYTVHGPHVSKTIHLSSINCLNIPLPGLDIYVQLCYIAPRTFSCPLD